MAEQSQPVSNQPAHPATGNGQAPAADTRPMMLEVQGLKVSYGGIQAVKGVDLVVRKGELVALIGANGAGKTTTLKAITAVLPANDGSIRFIGQPTKGMGSYQLVEKGLAMVPEGRGLYARMTIVEH